MLTLLVALAAAQPAQELSSQADSIVLSRAEPRRRAGVALHGGAFMGMTGTFVLPTLGLSGELGSRFDDDFSLVGRLSAVLNLLNLNVGLDGLFDYAFSERFALGAGAGMHVFFGYGVTPTLIAMIPLRFTFAPMTRSPREIERTGLILGLELGAGVVVFSVAGAGIDFGPIRAPSPWASAQLTIGWAWW